MKYFKFYQIFQTNLKCFFLDIEDEVLVCNEEVSFQYCHVVNMKLSIRTGACTGYTSSSLYSLLYSQRVERGAE